MMGDYFTDIVDKLADKDIKYVWFDFHHECKNMKYENLNKLVEEI